MAGGLGLLWSPLVTIGLMGFAALAWTSQLIHRETLSRMARDIANLAGAMIGLVLAFYLLSRYRPTGLPERYHTPPHLIVASSLALVPGQMPWRDFVADYTVFVLLEFLVLAMLLAAIHRGCRADLRVLIAATIVLIVLPFLTYGRYNDLVMRASIPALFVLQLFAAQAPGVLPRRHLLHGAVVAVLVVGAAYPLNMLRLSAAAVARRGALVRIPSRGQVADLFEQQLGLRERYFFIGQYVGALDSPFFRYLARRPVAVPRPARDAMRRPHCRDDQVGGDTPPPGRAGDCRDSRVVSAALAAALFGALLLFAHGNVPYTGFWFDEAVQFWISRGVPPLAAPHSPPGGIVAVVRENGRQSRSRRVQRPLAHRDGSAEVRPGYDLSGVLPSRAGAMARSMGVAEEPPVLSLQRGRASRVPVDPLPRDRGARLQHGVRRRSDRMSAAAGAARGECRPSRRDRRTARGLHGLTL
jgi:hypothetical protein